MDALPVTEETGLPFASEHPGRMHACGHDGHITIALGAAKHLNEHRSDLSGRLVFIFQPAEETVDGAPGMIRDGALEGVDAIVGLHIWPEHPAGSFAVRGGPVMASVDKFEITFRGRGGHGAMPHLCVDPVPAAAEAVLAYQRIVSREVSPLESAVVTVGKISGGTTFNVISEAVSLTGTIRSFDPDIRKFLEKRMGEISRGVAEASRCTVDFSYEHGVPPTINDDASAERFGGVLEKAFGPERIIRSFKPSMGGEDFSLFLEKVPGLYFYLGTRNEKKDCVYPLHHPKYRFDEDILIEGVKAFREIALDFLK
jgi:amidohydrolase